MTIKLRELIRNVRACKTAAEERAVIAKESALIRTAFKDQDHQYRHRNVAKLLYIHMLGYPSYFGQMECLKLVASSSYPEKRIGYLGLVLLLTDQEDVLTLVTNSLKNDLNHPDMFVAGMALTAVGNIASPDMARDLAIDVDKHLKSDKEYLMKKAALCAIRIFTKVPDLVEDFVDTIKNLLTHRKHGVVMCGAQLITDLIKLDPQNITYFEKLVPSLVKQLRNLLAMGHSADYDVSGISDPFLQVTILRLLRYLGNHNEDACEKMSDILAQVATNTETSKNAGNSILYECVQTIMATESESGLRVLAVNILGRFLLNRDNNIRYVALNTLSKIVTGDVAAVQRHRNTIVECLKDPDTSIRQRALELVYSLVNETNIRTLAREMLNYLVVAPNEDKSALCSKIADVVDQYAPSSRWQIDTLITMLSIAGSVLPDESISNSLIALIQQNADLHPYVVHKLFLAINEDLSQFSLVHVGIWCIGEYGVELMSPPPADDDSFGEKTNVEGKAIVNLLKKILRLHDATEVTKGYVLNAMLKLTTKIKSEDQIKRLNKYIRSYRSSMSLELQQRSCEYGELVGDEWGSLRVALVMKMPAPDPNNIRTRKKSEFIDDEDDEKEQSHITRKHSTGMDNDLKSPKKVEANLLDLDDIFGGNASTKASTGSNVDIASSVSSKTEAAPASALDLLSDIFSSTSTSSYQPQSASSKAPSSSQDDIMGLLDFNSSKYSGGIKNPVLTAYEKHEISITCELSKPNLSEPSITYIAATVTNSSSQPASNFVLQAAFPKFIKLQMEPPSGNVIPPNRRGQVTQLIKIQNSMHGQKPIMMKLKVQFMLNTLKVEDMVTVNSFPPNY